MISSLPLNEPRQRWMIGGLGLSLLTIFLGFVLGGVFGAQEDALKANLKTRAEAVLHTVYKGDTAQRDYVVGRGWTYLKRAHMHAGGIGSATAVASLTLLVLGRRGRMALATSMALGIGALLYPLFWLLAGLAAPGLGETDAAKEAYAWIAEPGAGLLLLGMLGVLIEIGRTLRASPK